MENTNYPFITRFNPAPTGSLHLGHAYALKVANTLALESGGHMVLRIDNAFNPNISQTANDKVYDVLQTFGLKYTQSAVKSQRRMVSYKAIKFLRSKKLLYPSEFISSNEINTFFQAPHDAPSQINKDTMSDLPPGSTVWRLDIRKAVQFLNCDKVTWFDYGVGMRILDVEIFPDIVVEITYGDNEPGFISYHVAVVVEDHMDGVNLVTRGNDLLAYTPLQVLLQEILNLRKRPNYFHHELIKDLQGNRLAKRNDALSLDALFDQHGPSHVYENMLPPVYIKDFIKG